MRSDCYIVLLLLFLSLLQQGPSNSASLHGAWAALALSSDASLGPVQVAELQPLVDGERGGAQQGGIVAIADECSYFSPDHFPQQDGNLFWVFLFAAAVSLTWWVHTRYQYLLGQQNALSAELDTLKQQLLAQTTLSADHKSIPGIDKAKIESAIDSRLGESAWRIIDLVIENPAVSNKELAAEMNLSLDGVSSALRRIYAAFALKGSGNKKVLLARKVVEINASTVDRHKE